MKSTTELVFILDRSGSMGGLETDTIGGFNSTLERQTKNQKDQVRVTTVLFDDKYKLLHDRIDLEDVKPITRDEYYVRGSTALLDAIGKTINKIKSVQRSQAGLDKKQKALFVIVTDGLENSSREYNLRQIKRMIEAQKEAGWEFLFLGANIDAIQTADSLGIGRMRAANFMADSDGIAASFDSVAEACGSFMMADAVSDDWKESVDADYANR